MTRVRRSLHGKFFGTGLASEYAGIFHERRVRAFMAQELAFANLRGLSWFGARAAGDAKRMLPPKAAEPILREGVLVLENWIKILRAMDDSCPYPREDTPE